MLTEDEVVDHTCTWLEANGWKILSRCHGTANGDDIRAEAASGRLIHVECKGAKSPRSGHAFSVTDVWSRVSGAIFNAIREIETDIKGDLFVIALPDVEIYRTMFKDLRYFCIRNKICVLWLGVTGVVDVWQHDLQIPDMSDSASERKQ